MIKGEYTFDHDRYCVGMFDTQVEADMAVREAKISHYKMLHILTPATAPPVDTMMHVMYDNGRPTKFSPFRFKKLIMNELGLGEFTRGVSIECTDHKGGEWKFNIDEWTITWKTYVKSQTD